MVIASGEVTSKTQLIEAGKTNLAATEEDILQLKTKVASNIEVYDKVKEKLLEVVHEFKTSKQQEVIAHLKHQTEEVYKFLAAI